MTTGDKMLAIGLLILGILGILFGIRLRENSFNFYYNDWEGILLGNMFILFGGIFAGGTSIVLITSRLKIRKNYQVPIIMLFLGAFIAIMPSYQTNGIYNIPFLLSFFSYPLIGLSIGIIFYSYFIKNLRVEMVQTKEDNKIISTTKVVWKENKMQQDHLDKNKKKQDINEQLMKQHTLLSSIEKESINGNSKSTRFCRYCGSKNKNDAVFCEKCGKNIT